MKKFCLSIMMSALALLHAYADCEISIGVGPMEAGEVVAPGIENQLEAKLQRALSSDGIMATGQYSQFFVTGRFDSSYFDMVGGGTASKYVVNTMLTVYIADTNGQVYASKSFELKGVGDTEERAYQKCLSSLRSDNRDFREFVQEAKNKIISYFNDNYLTYLTKAKTALSQRNYSEAMYYAGAVPECCNGYEQAQALLLQAYRDHTNFDALTLLSKAQAAWGANPNDQGAFEALGYLAAIDQAASCASEANKLKNTITRTMRSDFEYETRTKHEQALDIEKRRINAARDIGVAWAKSQPKTIYKTNFIVRHHYY